MLVALETYLTSNLKPSDVMMGRDNILLFNVNQVAYLVEGSDTHDKQRATRQRLKHAISPHETVTMKCTGIGKGEFFVHFETDGQILKK